MVVVGVDSAMSRVDLVALDEGCLLDCISIDSEATHRGAVLKEMWSVAVDWLQDFEVPFLFIEEPIMVRNLRVAIQLGETVGMLLALPYPAYLAPIDSWKQIAVGKGGVGKEEVRDSLIQQFPETELLFGTRQDLFDALGVAVYGENVVNRRLS